MTHVVRNARQRVQLAVQRRQRVKQCNAGRCPFLSCFLKSQTDEAACGNERGVGGGGTMEVPEAIPEDLS